MSARRKCTSAVAVPSGVYQAMNFGAIYCQTPIVPQHNLNSTLSVVRFDMFMTLHTLPHPIHPDRNFTEVYKQLS